MALMEETGGARDTFDPRRAPTTRYHFDGTRFFCAQIFTGDKEPRIRELELSAMDDLALSKEIGWYDALGNYIGPEPKFAADETARMDAKN